MITVLEALDEARKTFDKIYFRSNSGNAGDSLINLGFYSLAEEMGLEYEEVSDNFPYETLGKRDLVILSGGGNLVPYWDGGSAVIRRLTQYEFPLMLMPQSIEGREDVLRLLRKQDTLFLRERYSLDYAHSLGLECCVALGDDLAFSANLDILEAKPRGLRFIARRKPRKLLYIVYHFLRSRFVKTLPALRTDRESTITNRRKKKINDISRVAKFGTKNRDLNILSSYWLLKILSWYEVVETDRLHVFISCVLVGTKVVLHENAYHKIKGVYEYSVQDDSSYGQLVSLAARGEPDKNRAV